MKKYKSSDLTHKRAEVLKEAKLNGVIIQQLETNGQVRCEFLLIANEPLINSGHSIQMVRDMTNEQIIQLAEHFGVHMRTRPSGFVDNGDGTMSFKKVELHYAGQNVIDLIRAITAEGSK